MNAIVDARDSIIKGERHTLAVVGEVWRAFHAPSPSELVAKAGARRWCPGACGQCFHRFAQCLWIIRSRSTGRLAVDRVGHRSPGDHPCARFDNLKARPGSTARFRSSSAAVEIGCNRVRSCGGHTLPGRPRAPCSPRPPSREGAKGVSLRHRERLRALAVFDEAYAVLPPRPPTKAPQRGAREPGRSTASELSALLRHSGSVGFAAPMHAPPRVAAG